MNIMTHQYFIIIVFQSSVNIPTAYVNTFLEYCLTPYMDPYLVYTVHVNNVIIRNMFSYH